MKCTQIHTKLGLLSEGLLDNQSKKEVLTHLSRCKECSAKYHLLTVAESIIAMQKAIEPSPWLLQRTKQNIFLQNKHISTAVFSKQKASIRLVYFIAVSFAVISAFTTGYLIGKNNFQYLNSENRINQKQAAQSQTNSSTTDEQYQNSFSLY